MEYVLHTKNVDERVMVFWDMAPEVAISLYEHAPNPLSAPSL
jgi:hypothetical protein